MPLVSILVASYNHGAYLPQCIESVLAQELEDWELIIVDDQSSDSSVAVSRSFEDPRIRVFVNDSNLGTYGSQQRALELSSGRYIAVLNSDDYWAPEKLLAQVAALDVSDCSFCYTMGQSVDAEGRSLAEDLHGDWPTDSEQKLLPFLLEENRILASSVLFRREGLAFEVSCRYSGDWVALLQASLRGAAACDPRPLCSWRIHGSNTFTRSVGQVHEEIRIRHSIWAAESTWLQHAPAPQVRQRMALNLMHLSALEVLAGRRSRARDAALAAVRRGGGAAALKRLAVVMMPPQVALKRLWPNDSAMPTPPDLPTVRFGEQRD